MAALYLPYISPISPLYLPYHQVGTEAVAALGQALARSASVGAKVGGLGARGLGG